MAGRQRPDLTHSLTPAGRAARRSYRVPVAAGLAVLAAEVGTRRGHPHDQRVRSAVQQLPENSGAEVVGVGEFDDDAADAGVCCALI